MHGLGVYVRDSLPSARAYDYESPSHSFMCFKLLLFGSAAYYLFIVYRSPASQDCSILNEISDQMDRVLLSCPSAQFVIMGDFNAHHSTWLNSSVTDTAGINAHNFCLSHSLSQITSFPTRYPPNPSHSPSLLDLCFVSDCSSVISLSPLPPLGNSDHVLLELRLKCQSFHNQDSPFHRTSYDYNGADWDSFRAFIRDIPWKDGLGSLPASSCASELAEWIQIGIDEYIPHRRYQLKPHSAPWFGSDCAAALADRNRLFNLLSE